MIPQALIDKLQTITIPWSPLMYKTTLCVVLALPIVVPLVLLAIPMIEFFNGMAAQPKAKAQMTYGRVFGEALMTERLPVAGTVHREYTPYPFAHLANTLEEAQQAGAQLENPVAMNKENLLRGQQVYNSFCISCHGKEGHGDGPVTGPERFPAPPSLHTDQARAYRDGTIYHIITQGNGKMPSYAPLIEPEDRWKSILYVRAIQRAMNPTPEDVEQ